MAFISPIGSAPSQSQKGYTSLGKTLIATDEEALEKFKMGEHCLVRGPACLGYFNREGSFCEFYPMVRAGLLNVYEVGLVGNNYNSTNTEKLFLCVVAHSSKEVKKLLSPVSAIIETEPRARDMEITSDNIDLYFWENTKEEIIDRLSGKYAFIEGLYLDDYNLKLEGAAVEIARQCSIASLAAI